ncbi:MAG: UDP-N-acetylglucosamine diphosphorylase/glucosamine-1-phosphate N-acetyltransferase [Gammaproteobacteria bacterium]|nr:UDP-N-acetylglucosamine diphosphorylase/glucosamine-1-phosphate N-acetyltransferase [Gammaproteobacteria bacterium]NIR83286.1 UDP-N-acetylglucosamine diphosphorylase/glucosamine-1-phosphate N-acetyltransferase [Gammaproteobacteria bacterium]NIR91086.1 UDP-N-acetylglucosamine diphosphorylase/glucosamine-1-phosphate N-acetyltransferase [Gammaproteobacteria bacterium]NIU04453.1 UDP-N-acetylglucosamine diphosphorylase/glucosamine-1-phosphate N-acetyltransferase [Gammaproteobacteria bacterium]NIW
MSSLVVVILAAGQGKRMKSSLPKVLHGLAGRTLLEHVVERAQAVHPQPAETFVVYGHGGDLVPARLAHLPVRWVEQPEQRGTGHAVMQALPRVAEDATVLVLYGDVPLVDPAGLSQVVAGVSERAVALMTVTLENPSGYGRIRRDSTGAVVGVVEERDASAAERIITDVNTGILAARAGALRRWLSALDDRNAQGEMYLTDVVGMAASEGFGVHTVAPRCVEEVLGVNDRAQLAHLERHVQRLEAERLMSEGVTLRDPARFDVRGEVVAAGDVTIDVGVILQGRVVLGEGVSIGPYAVITDSEIGPHTQILANCVIEGARIGANCRVGPFSRMRPAVRLEDGVHVGNFVEIKQSAFGQGSKANHLSYVGDSEIGRRVNVGAGTIVCNYDGAHKHPTFIGDEAFIGSGTELVAPVKVGAGATIGAGSTITKDTPPGKLTLSRARQVTVEGWKRPRKK